MNREALPTLDERIDQTVAHIRAQHPDWRCRMGCDGCCRRLAGLPEVSAPEWERIQVGISTLSLEQQGEIHRAIQAATAASGFVVCPLLDLKHGLCTIYEVRPIACRTYGYYDQRGIGLYCKDIEQDVAEGRLDDVVWGSQEGVALDLKRLGPQRSLDEWLCASLDSKT